MCPKLQTETKLNKTKAQERKKEHISLFLHCTKALNIVWLDMWATLHTNYKFPLSADYSELGRRQADLCTARRETGTRLDTLAGGWQAAFGEDVWMDVWEGGRRRGREGDKKGDVEQGKK